QLSQFSKTFEPPSRTCFGARGIAARYRFVQGLDRVQIAQALDREAGLSLCSWRTAPVQHPMTTEVTRNQGRGTMKRYVSIAALCLMFAPAYGGEVGDLQAESI